MRQGTTSPTPESPTEPRLVQFGRPIQPIVSVSLGLPAVFHFGGLKRGDPVRKLAVGHGDVAVWGGPSRLCYHGVAELKEGGHSLLGRRRINLTFRKAL